MPTPEEEKIIICGAKINYDAARSIEASSDVMIEMYNLFTRTVTDFNDGDAEYFAFVRERALTIRDMAIEIKEEAENRLKNVKGGKKSG